MSQVLNWNNEWIQIFSSLQRGLNFFQKTVQPIGRLYKIILILNINNVFFQKVLKGLSRANI